jgi:hypothetical protein
MFFYNVVLLVLEFFSLYFCLPPLIFHLFLVLSIFYDVVCDNSSFLDHGFNIVEILTLGKKG